MRIIAGNLKGRRLTAPKNLPVRPTTDFAKEGLFNVLSNKLEIEGLNVLDLFAGTGNISFEFASRGAAQVLSVDKDGGCIRFIEKTTAQFNLNIQPIFSDVLKFLERSKRKFDLIFADPPYALGNEVLRQVHQKVLEKELLNSNGMLILEHSKHISLEGLTNFAEKRKYGNVTFSFYYEQ